MVNYKSVAIFWEMRECDMEIRFKSQNKKNC